MVNQNKTKIKKRKLLIKVKRKYISKYIIESDLNEQIRNQ